MTKRIIIIFAIAFSLFACNKKTNTEKNDNENVLATAPETKPQYDNTTFGVYKGVIVGSSGYIVFRINNGDNIVKGYLTMDNQRDTLSTTFTIVPGQPLSNILFIGKISSMRVSANADGSNASLSNIQINGHNNVTGFIAHEKSTRQVLCYEGTFSGGASGIINATRVGLSSNSDSTYILAKVQSVNDTTLYRGYGAMRRDTTVTIYLMDPGNNTAQFKVDGIFNTGNYNPNTFNGTWTGGYGNGNFTTKRTY